MLKEYKEEKKEGVVVLEGEDGWMNLGFEGKKEKIVREEMYLEGRNVRDCRVRMGVKGGKGGELELK